MVRFASSYLLFIVLIQTQGIGVQCYGITLSSTREITGLSWEFGFHILGEFGLFRDILSSFRRREIPPLGRAKYGVDALLEMNTAINQMQLLSSTLSLSFCCPYASSSFKVKAG